MRAPARFVLGLIAAVMFFANGFVQLARLSDLGIRLGGEHIVIMVETVLATALIVVRILPGAEVTPGRRRLLWAAAAIGIGMFGASGQPFVAVPAGFATAAALLDGPNAGSELPLDLGVVTVCMWGAWLLMRLVTT